METPIKILMLEDSEWDAELILRELTKSGINFTYKIVNTREDYENMLNAYTPDVILSDHSLPNFSSTEAFAIHQLNDISIPFILVTGTVSEEFAVTTIKQGVDDYILKNNLLRLPSAILQSIKAKKTELEKKRSQEEVVKSEIKIRNFATHLNEMIEEERARIVREVHDELGQQLTCIKFSLALCKKQALPVEVDKKMTNVLTDIETALSSVKKIATELRPAILDSFGLIPAIDWMSKEFEKKTNIHCSFKNNIEEVDVEKKVSTALFRICQETLTNIAKHSKASQAVIEMTRIDNFLTLLISDNGKGMDVGKLENSLSMGLIGMQERARIIGADLNIISRPSAGTSVKLSVGLN